MKYLKVSWIHNFPDEPVLLYSEIDDARWEQRKVDFFADGTAVFASEAESHGNTGLCIEPLPTLEEIGSDPQFQPVEISPLEFEAAWKEGKAKLREI
jgi:hypothetical protein